MLNSTNNRRGRWRRGTIIVWRACVETILTENHAWTAKPASNVRKFITRIWLVHQKSIVSNQNSAAALYVKEKYVDIVGELIIYVRVIVKNLLIIVLQ